MQYFKISQEEAKRATEVLKAAGITVQEFDLCNEYAETELDFYLSEYPNEVEELYEPFKEMVTIEKFKEIIQEKFIENTVFGDVEYFPTTESTGSEVYEIVKANDFIELLKAE